VRVLVVEDDLLIHDMVVDALQDEGFEVLQAADGREALSWCRQRAADVLVTDVVLPGGIDGWQIAESCREHHPDLHVIYTTGFSPVKPRPVLGSVFLQKPYRPTEIANAIRGFSPSWR
jgi:DNA-binding response OmpR family regulator